MDIVSISFVSCASDCCQLIVAPSILRVAPGEVYTVKSACAESYIVRQQ